MAAPVIAGRPRTGAARARDVGDAAALVVEAARALRAAPDRRAGARRPSLARIVAQLQTEWLWFDELGQEQVFWTMVASKWLAGSLAGLGTTMFLLANFWVVERAAPRDARLPRDQRAPPGCGASSCPRTWRSRSAPGCSSAAASWRADWQQLVLWLHRSDFGLDRPAVPPRRRLLRLLAAAVPEDRPLAVPHGRGRAGLHVRRARRDRRDPHEAGAGLGHAGGSRPPAGAGRAAAAGHRLAALARPVRAGASARGREAARARLHRRARRSSPGSGCSWSSRSSRRPCSSTEPCGGRGRSRRWPWCVVAFAELAQPRRSLPSVVQRFFVDPQTLSRERPYIADSVRFTQLAYGLHRVADRPLPANATISARRAAGEPGRPPQHPALGHRRPETADRPAAVDRLLLRLPRTPRSTATATTEGPGR